MNVHPVFFEDSSFKKLGNYLTDGKYSSLVFLADSNTAESCLPVIRNQVSELNNLPIIVIPAGEKNKTFDSVENIISELLLNKSDRKSLLVNVGGGMITDLGGFAASVYKRGIDFINIPTSLMAMCDASIGGKCGVNSAGVKNVAGTFAMPAAVYIYPGFLDTLPEREYKSAFAEIIKHILLSDAVLWDNLIADPENFFSRSKIAGLIDHSVKFKISVVADDFQDNNRRQILNFGHTYGHAIESCLLDSENSLLHGEAIAIGLIGELYLSMKMAGLKSEILSDAVRAVEMLFPALSWNVEKDDLKKYLTADKKNRNSLVGFSLLNFPGKPDRVSFPSDKLIDEGIDFMIQTFINKKQLINDKN